MRRRARPVVAACVAAHLLVLAAPAGAVPVRVRGEAAVRVVAFEQGAATVVRGDVADDVGASMPSARVEIAVDAARRAGPCKDGGAGTKVELRGKTVSVTTDERGSFCVAIEGGPRRGAAVKATVAQTELFDGASGETVVEGDATGLVKTTLRIESPPEDVDLDRPSFRITTTLGLDRVEAERLALGNLRREGLKLKIEDERGTTLAEATTGGDGRARFEVQTSAMAGPGRGELRVRFDGTTALRPARAVIPIERSARVTIATPDTAPSGTDDGVSIAVDVTTARGAVDGGVVEARAFGASVGAASVEGGRAQLVVTIPGARPGIVPVSLRFVPAAPWFVPGPELVTKVQIKEPSPIALVALFALVAAVGIWVLQRWRRPPKPKHAEPERAPKPPGHAEIVVVASTRGARGWRGKVIDAHDGGPLAGIEVSVSRPTFEATGVLATATTDEAGAFVLELDGGGAGGASNEATLRAEGALHAAIEQTLPPPGEVRIALVTRRRALLDRLVRWARAKGSPWDGPREPTPGHVRRVAARSDADGIEQWAGSIEHAAFGPAPVDRAVEQELRKREPGAQPR